MKFDHILFPIDFSATSFLLKKQVEWLAGRFGSQVTLLHVFEIPVTWDEAYQAPSINADYLQTLRELAASRLKEYVIDIPEDRLRRVIAEGSAAGHILNWSRTQKVDLVVMGTRGCGTLPDWLLGSTTSRVLNSLDCSVWTSSPSQAALQRFTISNILSAVELTEETIPLLRFTKQLAEDLHANVQLVHSVPELQTRPNRYFDFDLHRYLMESARVELAKMQREADTDFPVTVSGLHIADAIREVAGTYEADLIVVGRGKAQHALGRFRSHIYEIVRSAPCSVFSYSLNPQDYTSSSCTEAHLFQSAEAEPLPTGCRKF